MAFEDWDWRFLDDPERSARAERANAELQKLATTRQMLRVFLLDLLQEAHFSHFEENPLVRGTILEAAPKRLVGYDHLADAHDAETWLHFYVYDYRFLPLYHPRRRAHALAALKPFGGVFGTDHSVYRNLPLPEQRYSIYLNRLTDFWFEREGIRVVPNVSWGDERSFDFCFEGLPEGTSIAVSSHGCIRDKQDCHYFVEGFKAAIYRLRPRNVFHFGKILDEVKTFAEAESVPLIRLPTRQERVYAHPYDDARKS